MSRRAGFTLLEICIALFLALLLVTLAVPGIRSMLAEQRLKASFDAFDRWVRKAREQSIAERRSYALVWTEKGIVLVPAGDSPVEEADVEEAAAEAPDAAPPGLVFAEGEAYSLARPAALMKEPPPQWVFWRSGLCEEAVVTYAGEAGKWTVRYDPLTARGIFVDSEVK